MEQVESLKRENKGGRTSSKEIKAQRNSAFLGYLVLSVGLGTSGRIYLQFR